MARQNISLLRATQDRRFWPSLSLPGLNGERFDILTSCESEDRLRRRYTLTVTELAQQFGLLSRRSARRLAARLDYEQRGKKAPRSLASSVYMRNLRDRVFSQLWRLVEAYPGRVTTFTAIKRGWAFTPEQLLDIEVDKLLAGFLSDINRRGAADADGWLIAFIHGERETPAGIFRLHLHGIVAGQMIGVLDRLRTAVKYKYIRNDSVRFRLRIARKPLTNLPHSLTYCLKSYWPWKHVILGANGKRRTRRHKRIPEPYHTQVLLFLDRHSANDLVVLKHLHVAGGRLKLSSRRARKQDR